MSIKIKNIISTLQGTTLVLSLLIVQFVSAGHSHVIEDNDQYIQISVFNDNGDELEHGDCFICILVNSGFNAISTKIIQNFTQYFNTDQSAYFNTDYHSLLNLSNPNKAPPLVKTF